MADKQLAYDARKKTDHFDEDDPLAELARIVGFEPRVAANTIPDVPRQEPAFNLEDELLREFERFDAPRPLAALDRPAEPAVEEYDYPAADAVVEPEPVEPSPATSPVSEEAALLSAADWAAPARPEPVSGGARDLIEELELSIGGTAVQNPQPSAKVPQWAAASIRLPLANFHAVRREAPVEAHSVEAFAAPEPEPAAAAAPPQPEPVAQPEPAAEPAAFDAAQEFVATATQGYPAELDRHEEVAAHEAPLEPPVAEEAPIEVEPFDLVAAATEGAVQADAALTEALPEEESIAFDLDDLLADVSRYPVPQRSSMEPAAEPAEAFEQWEPFVAAPAAVVTPAPAAEFKAAAEPVASQADDIEDPFAGHDFELDLEGIELELADFDFAESAKQQAPEPAPAPVAVAAPSFAAAARPAVQAAVAPVYEAPAPAAVRSLPVVEDTDEELPFDAAMIAEADQHPEAVEDMHVPTLPPVEQPAPIAAANDFDFDVDVEIASLFETPAPVAPTPAAPAWAPPAAAWTTSAAAAVVAAAPVAPVASARPQPAGGPDEFERALEEDFRRSVREPIRRTEAPAEVRIQSATEAEDLSRARSMKRLLAAAALVVIFAGGAYGVYSMVTDGGLGIAGGEPPVIMADKDPIKIVPENPGGKTVPNQDKAVYDRVAGATEAPKQKALVSSDEEPVDVVQRTLAPDALPEDNESVINDAAVSTPVEDTQDPRLLPSETAADNTAATDAAENGDRPLAIAPRKVRTMIVKPDGTLVARDEPAEPVEQPVAQAPAPAAAAGGSAASFPANNEVASADIRATPVQTTPVAPLPPAQQASPSGLQKAAAADAASFEDQPASPAQAAPLAEKPADTAPIPSARPTEQPVNVVGTVTERGKVRPAEQQPKPAEVASAEPAAAQPQQAAPSGGYAMQIASLPSEAEANKTFASLSKKFSSVLAGRSFEVRKADIAGKGTFYRLRIPAGSKDEAAALCGQYRAAGGSCLISK
ncbi:sporulation protein [Rhizobium sp. P32RR-XVIII]|uniref:SPOR domain-containing protein n=1 Tax=Rhizobium sp. P32RR-XVIII TaxID=2726738 RepID=UPI001456EFE2|nr:SPOR domain-containing protein [Rhizobium sp. P32RR-XVIII]NLS03496.1 sporulation protein [Rhizobium sp. P32RR-XVIII]